MGIEICCPVCKGPIFEELKEEVFLKCNRCKKDYPVIFGIPDLRVFPDPYIKADEDRAKGLRVAEQFDTLNFSELVKFYYSITSAVPPEHARQYTQGVMAAEHRASGALKAWEAEAQKDGNSVPLSLLEIGCGTAPLLLGAAQTIKVVAGVDIAFRWLVIGKKRLAEAGLSVPLFCACAEALPFPDGYFDRIVADSTLEHLRDQEQALGECYRTLRSEGYIFISTPNRFSLGPDPQAGLWGGGLLPEWLVAAYVSWKGGIPPKRRLLSVNNLNQLLSVAMFSPPRIFLQEITPEQRKKFGRPANYIIDIYHQAIQFPFAQRFLQVIGPLLYAVSKKSLPSS